MPFDFDSSGWLSLLLSYFCVHDSGINNDHRPVTSMVNVETGNVKKERKRKWRLNRFK